MIHGQCISRNIVYFWAVYLKRSTDIPTNKCRKFSGTELSCLKTGINKFSFEGTEFPSLEMFLQKLELCLALYIVEVYLLIYGKFKYHLRLKTLL